jgi:membrane protein
MEVKMVPATPKIYLTQAGPAMRFWSLLRVALIESYRNNSLGLAKGAAYSGLLAFFPVITTLATLLVQARAEAVARTVASLLYEAVPPGTEDAVRTLFAVHGQQPKSLLVIATVLAAFAASGAMISLMEGFQAVYHIRETRSMVRERAVAMLLVFVTAIPVLGASALIVFGARTERTLIGWLGATEFEGWVVLAGLALRYCLAFAAFVLVAALMYYLGPNRKQRLSQVFPGALLATVLWLLSTLAFGWYVRNIANYNLLYGSIGGGLALLVWMYLMAVIALLGCEFNAARERAAGTAKPA